MIEFPTNLRYDPITVGRDYKGYTVVFSRNIHDTQFDDVQKYLKKYFSALNPNGLDTFSEHMFLYAIHNKDEFDKWKKLIIEKLPDTNGNVFIYDNHLEYDDPRAIYSLELLNNDVKRFYNL